MLLLGLFFAGCKRFEEPNPEAPQNATIEKIKAWYNPKIERLKGAKSTGIDIYYPQWGKGILYNLPNGEKVALFPVHREKNVQYHQIGFVRRFAVYLTAQDSIKNVRLVEMIGNKDYLLQHKETLAKRYVLGDTLNWKQAVWSKNIYLPSTQNNKIGPGNPGIPVPCQEIAVTYFKASFGGKCYFVTETHSTCGVETQAVEVPCPNESGGGGSGGTPPSGGGSWSPPPPSGSPSDGGGPGGGSSSAPIYTVNPLCTNCPFNTLTPDPGDNTLPDEPPLIDVSPELDSIWNKSPYLTYIDTTLISKERAMKMIDSVFSEGIKENPKLKRMYDSLKVDFKFHFQVYSSGENGRYYKENNLNRLERFIFLDTRLFLHPKYKQKLKLTLFEELFHAYQDRFYGATIFTNLVVNHMINIECEQRFFIEYLEYTTTNDPEVGGIFKSPYTDVFFDSHQYFQKRFKAIMKTVKETGGPKPNNMGVGSKYFTEFMEDLFRKEYEGTPYTAKPTDFNQLPQALFSLF